MYKAIPMALLLALPGAGLQAMNNDKVTLCHNYGEITVAEAAVQAHLNHGDIIKEEGVPCPRRPGTDPEPENGETMSLVVMMRCEAQGEQFVVTSFSASSEFAIDAISTFTKRSLGR